MKIKYPYLLFLICVAGYSQSTTYSYQRELQQIESQWHSVVLPTDMFEKTAADFADIRIFGFTASKDTIEAPYLLKSASEKIEQVEVPFTLINQSKNKQEYFFTFETPVASAINQIQLDFKSNNFDWKVGLEGSQDQQEWFTLLTDYRILSINTENTRFQYNQVHFPAAKYRYFRLVIPSADPPELRVAKLLLSTVTAGSYNTYPIKSQTVEEDKKNKVTVIHLELKSAVPVSKLTLSVKNKYDYFRPIHISYLTDSVQTEKGWKYTYRQLTSGTLNSVEKSEFNLESTLLKKLKLVIENQDNVPLQIDSVKVEGYVHELVVRFTEPATYFLTYGNPFLQKPNYDIARFLNRIPVELSALEVGNEQVIQYNSEAQGEPLFQNTFWLWGVMILIILLLGWFSLKMIRQK